MSRVDSVVIARKKAGRKTFGGCLASDGFFPKPDSITQAAACGIKAIIQPGGSIADKDIISACNRRNIAMVATGVRHFTH
jgi:phosphoribosylaminoimidazolecarboxamide formyltransferase/IMP cyclohydrolase